VSKKPAAKRLAAEKPAVEKPTIEKVAAKKPAAEKATAKKPTVEKPAAKKPTAKKPAAKKPVAKKPTAEKPAAKRPAAEKPAVEKPVAEKAAAKATEEIEGEKDIESEDTEGDTANVRCFLVSYQADQSSILGSCHGRHPTPYCMPKRRLQRQSSNQSECSNSQTTKGAHDADEDKRTIRQRDDGGRVIALWGTRCRATEVQN
jgi:hypothetical protein